MTVTILGNNSALPAFGRHPTCQAIAANSEVILLDCGEGTQIQMQRYGIKWRKLHHIFISHLHGDHYFGLPGLLNSMSLMGRTEPLYLHAPAELQEILDLIFKVADTQLSFPFYFAPLPQGHAMLTDGNLFSVSCFPVEHRIDCHGFLVLEKNRGRRIVPELCEQYGVPRTFFYNLKAGEDYVKEDRSIIKNELVTEDGPKETKYAYCADTLYSDSYLPYIRDVDGLYHESTYLHADADRATTRFHSTAVQAAMMARQANAGKLLLGHFSSKYKELTAFQEEAEAIFNNTVVTTEGVTYTI